MKSQKYIQKAEETLKLLDSVEKIKSSAFFETRQLACVEAKLQAKNYLFNWQIILKPAFIVFLIGINISIVYSYVHRVNTYVSIRNSALLQLSNNYIRIGDYYFSTHN